MGKPEQRVAIVGRVPPTYGGNTVHVWRLMDRLLKAGFPVRLYELGGKSIPERQIVPGSPSAKWFFKFLCTCSESIVHMHTNDLTAMTIAGLILPARGRSLVLTMHSHDFLERYAKLGRIRRRLWRTAASRAARILCVSSEIKDWLVNVGMSPQRLIVLPAFIPPSPAEIDPCNVPEEACDFLRRHKPVIASHGWFGYFYNGNHVYSFDMLLQLLERLRASYPTLGLYTVVSGTGEPSHREELLRLRREKGLEDHWLILEKPFHAISLHAQSDLFVRPTVTDGDSISIRECLALGIPVVASDCVARPEGCIDFRNRDLDSLIAAVSPCLAQAAASQPRSPIPPAVDTAGTIEVLYRGLLNGADSTEGEDLPNSGHVGTL